MNESQQFKETYSNTREVRESVVTSVWAPSQPQSETYSNTREVREPVVTSVWVPPPPPPPRQQRQSTFDENSTKNSNSPPTTNQIYKSELVINPTLGRSIDQSISSRCSKCKCLIDNQNVNEIKFNNLSYHFDCFKCSICQLNLNDLTNNKFEINSDGELVCFKCQLPETKICFICRQMIIEGQIIKFDQNNYHLNCFNCDQCKKCLINETNLHISNSKPCCSKCYSEYFSPRCEQCFKPISTGKILTFDEKKYHLDCFRCGQCNEIVNDTQLYRFNSKPCCLQCYNKYHAPQCTRCSKIISNETSTNLNGNKYHLNCFRCYRCDQILIDKQIPVENGKPYCIKCYSEYLTPQCIQCLKPISNGKSILYNQNKYHPECFRCIQCNQILNDSQFYIQNSKPCCNKCFDQYFSLKCSKCFEPILDKYTTFKDKHFHIQCFICQKCHRIIQTKDKFYNDHQGILCSTCVP